MSLDDNIRSMIQREIEALDIPRIVRDEVRKILLAGLGTSAKNSKWAGERPAKPPPEDFPCDQCEFVAKSSQGLGRHRYIKHGDGGHRSKHATEEDRKSADKIRNRSRRERRQNNEEDNPGGGFKCDDCGQTFSRQNGLTRHIHDSHEVPAIREALEKETDEAARVKCGICDEGFKSAHGLRIHQMRQHDDQTSHTTGQEVVCDICKQTFSTRGIKRHMTVMHKAGAEPFNEDQWDTETDPRPPSLGELMG